MRTFLEYYRRSIQPQIEMIDIFLKTEQPPYDKAAVAEVLGLSAEALTARMQKEHLAYITKGIFFRLLAEGENSLGGMLKRAVACGLPERYTPETAAYVFGLPLAAVREAAEKQIAPLFLRRPCRSCFLKSCFAKYQIFRKRGGCLFVRQKLCQCNRKGDGCSGRAGCDDVSVHHNLIRKRCCANQLILDAGVDGCMSVLHDAQSTQNHRRGADSRNPICALRAASVKVSSALRVPVG